MARRRLAAPDALRRSSTDATCDVAGFLRGWRYLRDFDPVAVPRFFAPFALFFNYTPRATAFLELLASIAGQSPNDVSDDFILQEAWLRHQQQLSVMVLPPDLVGHEWPLREDQAIYVGISGNVSQFKGKARQHTADLFDAARRKAVLMKEADAALKSGRDDDALVLFRHALAAVPRRCVSRQDRPAAQAPPRRGGGRALLAGVLRRPGQRIVQS